MSLPMMGCPLLAIIDNQWVESIGLMAPKTYVRLEDCKRALAAGEIEFPLFMKPRWGSGSIGLESIADMEELDIYYGLLMKKIKKTILATWRGR